jgi:hypothetical protein
LVTDGRTNGGLRRDCNAADCFASGEGRESPPSVQSALGWTAVEAAVANKVVAAMGERSEHHAVRDENIQRFSKADHSEHG